MIIRDLFFESGSTEATKIKKKYCKGMSFIFLIKNCPVIHCVYRFVMVVRKNVLEYIIAFVVVKNKVRLKR
jgi:hypothetical protein